MSQSFASHNVKDWNKDPVPLNLQFNNVLFLLFGRYLDCAAAEERCEAQMSSATSSMVQVVSCVTALGTVRRGV